MVCGSSILPILWVISEDKDLTLEEKIRDLKDIKQAVEDYIALCQDRLRGRKSNDEK